ncbi:hypothetical protein [Devosia sp.]|uniref:hypothetical protein n=1 Tax=Devosia sp. TaxID=1871048 RepID=UPI0019DC65BE|nr:hypothetical protein [Devosia sp.]MBE0579826.1 hypothetical protein [Devosia sp.]
MVDIISYTKVIEHERLLERLGDLRDVAATACREAPDLPASPTLVFTAAALLGDIYRLVSREPGARALARLDRRQQLSHRELVALLRDARLVLDGFAWNHRDHDAHYGDGWLTYEGIEEFRQSR